MMSMSLKPIAFGCFLISTIAVLLTPNAVHAQDDIYCFDPFFESKVQYHSTNPKYANMLLPSPQGQYEEWKPDLIWEMDQFAERDFPPIHDIIASKEEICAGDLIHYVIWDSSATSKATQSAWCEARIKFFKGLRGIAETHLAAPGEEMNQWGEIRQKKNLLVKYANGYTYEDPKAKMPTRKWNSGYGMPTSTTETLVLDGGEYIGYTGWFTGVCYGHFLTDQLPSIAYLRAQRPNAKIILLDTPMSRNIIQFIDMNFYNNGIVWALPNQHVMIRHGALSIYKPETALPTVMGRNLFRYFWDWMKVTRPSLVPPERKYVIYYTRHNPIVTGGRQIERNLELQIIELIHLKMAEHGKTEELYVFNGNDENGNTLSVAAQFHLFRSATTAIGPHGTGLVNAIWMDPFPETCSQRPQMLEFTPGPDSIDVHGGLFNGHYTALGRGFPMMEYNMITYTAESTKDVVYINLDDLALALDRMWGSVNDF